MSNFWIGTLTWTWESEAMASFGTEYSCWFESHENHMKTTVSKGSHDLSTCAGGVFALQNHFISTKIQWFHSTSFPQRKQPETRFLECLWLNVNFSKSFLFWFTEALESRVYSSTIVDEVQKGTAPWNSYPFLCAVLSLSFNEDITASPFSDSPTGQLHPWSQYLQSTERYNFCPASWRNKTNSAEWSESFDAGFESKGSSK